MKACGIIVSTGADICIVREVHSQTMIDDNEFDWLSSSVTVR